MEGKGLTSASGMVREASPGLLGARSGILSPGVAVGSASSVSPKSQSPREPPEDPVMVKQVSTGTDKALASQKDLADVNENVDGDAAAVRSTSASDKKAHRRQYVFKGPGSALAVQLFVIDEKYEMR